jgi:CBS domain-containing protein
MVSEAVAVLSDNNIGALIIVNETGAVAGILSERDIIRGLRRGATILGQTVEEVMSSAVTVGSLDDDVDPVLQRMTAGHFRHLPVVDDGRLVGMVTTADLVQAQMAQLQGEVETLETRLMDDSEE